MIRFLAYRFVQSIIVVWVVYTLTFSLLMLSPGDPFVGDEKNVAESVRTALAETYGLQYLTLAPEVRAQLPAHEKFAQISHAYFLYLGRAVTGNFGPSIKYHNFSVNDIIRTSLPVSVTLGAVALLFALWGGVLAGILGAVRKGKTDLLLSTLTLLGVSLPTFVVGALLMMLFVVYFPILPAAGWGSWQQILLPAFTLSLFYLAYIARLARSSTLDILSADFIRTARAKGLSPSKVLLHHAGANAALPILSYLGPAAANILVGSFVVEKLFAIPGLGAHFVNGCLNKDIPLVLGTVMVYTLLVVLFNLLVDLAYAFVDPRISLR